MYADGQARLAKRRHLRPILAETKTMFTPKACSLMFGTVISKPIVARRRNANGRVLPPHMAKQKPEWDTKSFRGLPDQTNQRNVSSGARS